VLGSGGVERIVEFKLTPAEQEAMLVSEKAVRGQMAATGL
jgi:malate/lactate dehydrogenase